MWGRYYPVNNLIPVIFSNCRLSTSAGRIIILSIHQPRYSIIKRFDTLTLLSRGEMVYHGPSREALEYFSGIGEARVTYSWLYSYWRKDHNYTQLYVEIARLAAMSIAALLSARYYMH